MPVVVRGQRVRITGTLPGDPAPLPIGLEGTVINVMNASTPIEQIDVDWDLVEGEDRPRNLFLLRTDPFEIVSPKRRGRGTLVSQPE
ncbi:hypothetical protein SEA_RASPUTIA_109 [Microbacterium phage Rasputia]|nr:hypothetical protein SEA_RASPUTIA_109 [Microbacterium phage Rasputia]